MVHMEQKLYSYEIMLNLLKGENHLRKIAKDLSMSHMTVKRALDSLVSQNVLDIKKEGRNSVYSIKKTLEGRNMVYMAEIYRLGKLIKKHPELKQGMVELKKITAGIIIIFGSYAKEAETENSDVDIYIEAENRKIREEAEKISGKFSVKAGLYDRSSLLIREIEKNHVIVKGTESFYEKNNFFD